MHHLSDDDPYHIQKCSWLLDLVSDDHNLVLQLSTKAIFHVTIELV